MLDSVPVTMVLLLMVDQTLRQASLSVTSIEGVLHPLPQ